MAVDTIVGAVADRSARGIAASVGRLISDGSLTIGERLPTVRDLARSLGTSPTTVSEAWQTLAGAGAIETRGRLGTFVLASPGPSGPRRYRRLSEGPGHFERDLSTGTPDPRLLPDLGPVLGRVSKTNLTTSYLDVPVLPELDELLRATWPFPAAAMTVVDGAMDAIDRVASLLIRHGDRVLVEHPSFPPLLDLLEQLGAQLIGLPMDDDGIVPDALATALPDKPVALFLQPRAHNPTGVSMTVRRARALAKLLAPTDVTIVEDDHAGDIANAPLSSIGTSLPDRTVHIRSFSKSHGPDLRLAAVGGASEIVERVVDRRLLGPGWSSRLLQAVLVQLLRDERTAAAIERARETYAERRAALCDALGERDVAFTGEDGINLWIEVADERSALLTLAARGVGAAPGAPFMVYDEPSAFLRLTISNVRDGVAELADLLALAAGQGRPGRVRPRR